MNIESIRICDDALVERLKKIHIIAGYVQDKLRELEEYNAEEQVDTSSSVNGRRMTNIGTFRAYVVAYLRHHKKIHQQMTFLVRQLPPGPNGLPLEIYVFTNDTAWANYEAIQADIFDHILAVVPEFDLSVFQNPTGRDFSSLSIGMTQREEP